MPLIPGTRTHQDCGGPEPRPRGMRRFESFSSLAARWWPWLVVVLVALAAMTDAVRVWHITNHHDLDVFMLAARRLVAGEDIYADTARFQNAIEAGNFSMRDDTVVWPYAYTPFIAVLFTPLTALPAPLVRGAWWLLNLGGLAAAGWLTLRALGPLTPARVLVALLVLYRFEPAVTALRLGQIEIAQLLLLTLGLYAMVRRRETLAGLVLGMAAGIKFFPLALVGLLVWKKRWRAAAWCLGTAVLLSVGSFALIGPQSIPRYLSFTSIYGVGGAFAAFPLNQSLNGFWSRNLVQNVFTPTLRGWHLPQLARTLTLVSSAVIVLGCAWLTKNKLTDRATSPSSSRDDKGTMIMDRTGQRLSLEYSLALVTLILVSPHSQVYAYVWCVPAFIVATAVLLSDLQSRWWQWLILGLAYLLVGRHYQFFYPGLTRFVQSHYLFGALLLWLSIALEIWLGQKDSPDAIEPKPLLWSRADAVRPTEVPFQRR